MRFITFLGLTMIAKAINPELIAEYTSLIMTVLIIASIGDIYEMYTRKK